MITSLLFGVALNLSAATELAKRPEQQRRDFARDVIRFLDEELHAPEVEINIKPWCGNASLDVCEDLLSIYFA